MSNDSIFKLDRKFTKELRQRLLKNKFLISPSMLREKKLEVVPSIEQLEEIILALFWASTQHEEGRLSRFRVTYTKQLLIDYLALVFDSPKRLNSEELRKLAPAVLPPDGQIGVWPQGEKGELYIWGLQTTDLTSLTFEVIDPGRVTISVPHFKVAEITGQRAGFISSEWNRGSLELMSMYEVKGHVTPTSPVLSYLSIYTTLGILRRMRLLGHGGAIIFVPKGRKWEQSVDKPIFYACEQRLNEMQRIKDAFIKELRKIDNNKDLGELGKVQKGMEIFRNHQYKIFLGDAARSIAYLTAVDGATVLNNDFEVIAFGAKLRLSKKKAKAGEAETVIRILPLEGESGFVEVELDQEFRGTRHMSAAQFVIKNPESVAFVVSQDGGITGLVMGTIDGDESNPKLLAYKGLELLL